MTQYLSVSGIPRQGVKSDHMSALRWDYKARGWRLTGLRGPWITLYRAFYYFSELNLARELRETIWLPHLPCFIEVGHGSIKIQQAHCSYTPFKFSMQNYNAGVMLCLNPNERKHFFLSCTVLSSTTFIQNANSLLVSKHWGVWTNSALWATCAYKPGPHRWNILHKERKASQKPPLEKNSILAGFSLQCRKQQNDF